MNNFDVNMISTKYTHYMDERFFQYPMFIGLALIGIVLLTFGMVYVKSRILAKRYAPLFIVLSILVFAGSIYASFRIGGDHMRTTSATYTFTVNDDYVLKQIKKEYKYVKSNKDGTYSVIEYFNE